MTLGRILGTVVSTIKHDTYYQHKLLVLQPIDEYGEDMGRSFLAIDWVQAGKGDVVLALREGNGIRQIMGIQLLPVRGLIVAIVDRIDPTEGPSTIVSRRCVSSLP